MQGKDITCLVNKSLRDNFGTWGPQETDLNLIDGVSLRQQIYMDKQRATSGAKVAMGKLYYAGLRNKYSTAFSADKQLLIANPCDPEDPSLTSALEGVISSRRSFESSRKWAQATPPGPSAGSTISSLPGR